MSNTKLRPFAAAITFAALGLPFASAGAHYNPDFVPDAPGIGDPRGVYGSGPEIEIVSQRVEVFRKTLAPIALECSTSTRAGCSGVLELTDQGGRESSARFDLDEGEAQNVFLTLPVGAARLARSRAGWTTQVKAVGRDSVGRSDTDTATVRIVRRHRRG